MKNVSRRLIVLLIIVVLMGCNSGEINYNQTSWEIKAKKLRLDYLKELYEVRNDIPCNKKLAKIDSLINQEL